MSLVSFALIASPVLIFSAIAGAMRFCYPFLSAAKDFSEREIDFVREAIGQRFESLKTLSPRQFEFAIGKLFEVQGWSVTVTSAVADGGKDLVLERDGITQLVEVKQLASHHKVGRPMINILHSAVISEGAQRGVFVTTSSFTETAKIFAEDNGIALIDGKQLSAILISTYPSSKLPIKPRAMCSRCGEIVHFKTLQDAFDNTSNKTEFLAQAILDAAWHDKNPSNLLGELQNVDLNIFQRAWKSVQRKYHGLKLQDFDPSKLEPF